MPALTRHDLLRSLDDRHEDLARQLDELNERIEHALAATGAGRRDDVIPIGEARAAKALSARKRQEVP
jgi:hypothetical protein